MNKYCFRKQAHVLYTISMYTYLILWHTFWHGYQYIHLKLVCASLINGVLRRKNGMVVCVHTFEKRVCTDKLMCNSRGDCSNSIYNVQTNWYAILLYLQADKSYLNWTYMQSLRDSVSCYLNHHLSTGNILALGHLDLTSSRYLDN
jgi:hypothetical protein